MGSNTGHFSALAAQLDGAEVVGIDSDAVAAGRAWRMARDRGLNILPLVVDLARPTPAVGWKNRECASFLDRAAGEFDCVLMLAVLHHMLVAERVPLEEILDLAAQLTRNLAVIEFVAPQDPMFRELTRGRDHLHEGLSVQSFEQACGRWFRVCRQERLPELARWMFVLRRLS